LAVETRFPVSDLFDLRVEAHLVQGSFEAAFAGGAVQCERVLRLKTRNARHKLTGIVLEVVNDPQSITSQFIDCNSGDVAPGSCKLAHLLVDEHLRFCRGIEAIDQDHRSAGWNRTLPVAAVGHRSRRERNSACRIRLAVNNLKDGDSLLLSVIENPEVLAVERCGRAVVHHDIDENKLTLDPDDRIVLRRPPHGTDNQRKHRKHDSISPKGQHVFLSRDGT
jgi:hypothetical protein